jgi:hypothetical protein
VKRVVVTLFVCLASVASAGPKAILVLKAEGTADQAARGTIDAQVLRLAKNIDGKVDAGEVTLTEAAAMVGCNPSETSCKDDVMATLGADEMVATTVTATPTGLNVTVRRITKSGAPKAAQTTIPTGKQPDAKMNADIGPLFGLAAAPAPVEDTKPVATAPPPPPPPPSGTTTTSAATTPPAKPATTTPPPAKQVAQADTSPMNHDVTAAPNGQIVTSPEGQPNRKWEKIGMGVGGGMMVLGVLLWAKANSIQDDIDAKPMPRSPADFKALSDLEKQGDGAAGGGNLFFIVGAGVAGVSAYYYWRAGRSHSTQTARIAPAAFPHGAGLTLSFGGAP